MEYRFSGTVKLGGVGMMSAEAEEALEEAIDKTLAAFVGEIEYSDERGRARRTAATFGQVHVFLPAPSDTRSL